MVSPLGDADEAVVVGAVRPPVSVVIPTRDRPEMLQRCLESVVRAVAAGDEIIVVDSASREAGAIEAVAERMGAQLVRCPLPGASRARNAGAAAASRPIVAFVDDDVWVDARWAAALAVCLAEHPEADFVTGRIESPDDARMVAIMDDQDPVAFNRSFAGRIGHSASMAVRADVLTEVGGFDAMLGAGAPFRASEDGDLFDRLLAAGFEGRHEPAARAWHEQWRSKRQMVRLHHAYGIGAGAAVVKMLRIDRGRARLRAREYLWQWGLAYLPVAVRRRAKLDVVMTCARLWGMVTGLAKGLVTPVEDGHFRPRRRGFA